MASTTGVPIALRRRHFFRVPCALSFLFFFALFCCTPTASFAAAKNEVTARVVAIKPDGTLTLSSFGEAVLAAVVFPQHESAITWLNEYALQRETTLTPGDEDRYGRTQMYGQLQHDMLNDGAAVIYATGHPIPDTWFAAEARARAARRGVWDPRAESVHIMAENAAQHVGRFHVVEGTITRIYESKTATYLNFGVDWRTDFSVSIPARHRRSMAQQLASLKPGSRLAIRGVLHEENGPMITLIRPENLEMR